jgi:hypothetical protein
MDLDLRVPVGLLFVTLGLIMSIFGLTSDPAIYHKSLGINVNLDWGLVELIFGSLMIAFGRSHRGLKTAPAAAVRPASSVVTSKHDLPPPPVPQTKPPVGRT